MSIREIKYGKETNLAKVKISIEFEQFLDGINLVNECSKSLRSQLSYNLTTVTDNRGKKILYLFHKRQGNVTYHAVIDKKCFNFYADLTSYEESVSNVIYEVKKVLYLFLNFSNKVLGKLRVKNVYFQKDVILNDETLKEKYDKKETVIPSNGTIIKYRKLTLDDETILRITTSLDNEYDIKHFIYSIDSQVDKLYNLCTRVEEEAE